MARLGIIGGVGPDPTAQLYLKINAAYFEATEGSYPQLVIDNLAHTRALEAAFITERASEAAKTAMTALLRASCERLLAAGCTQIALPCNTLHSLIGPALAGRAPLLSLVSATLAEAERRGYRRLGLLSTASTRSLALYEERGPFALVYPTAADQAWLNQALMQLIVQPQDAAVAAGLTQLIAKLAPQVDAIVLACTDLTALAPQLAAETPVPVLDSLTCLADACTQALLKNG